MTTLAPCTIERIDDVPLLLAQLERMEIRPLLDRHFWPHGNWVGLSFGWVVTLWLAHLLSQGDHCLSHVEPWAMDRREMLRRCTGQAVDRLDLADDHLAVVRRAFADDGQWEPFEAALAARLLRVYDLTPDTVRLDTTTASSDRAVTPDGLFQFGQSKDHRPDLPQVKAMLATLDPLGLPLATTVVAGQRADDPLYVPAIRRVRGSVGRRGLLYVGDCKMSALSTRAFLQQGGDYYLCPLSASQMPPEEWDRSLQPVWDQEQALTPIYGPGEAEGALLAEGYERSVPLTAVVAGETVTWTERRLVVRSLAQAESEEKALRDRVAKTVTALEALNQRGPGCRPPADEAALQARIAAVLKRYHVEALLAVAIRESGHERRVRGYRGQPARVVVERDWQVTVSVPEAALAAAVRRLGWRVFVTNGPAAALPLEPAVAAYRGQFRIERGIGRLKGRPLSLTPMYLAREEHVVGLIRLLSLALRVLCLVEFVVRRSLAAAGERLTGLYAGQPKRATAQPTSEALLRAFCGLHLVRVHGVTATLQEITPLSALQERIVALLELPPDTYSRLLCDSSHADSK
jgi:transposase